MRSTLLAALVCAAMLPAGLVQAQDATPVAQAATPVEAAAPAKGAVVGQPQRARARWCSSAP